MKPDYGYEFRRLEVADDGEYPVAVTLAHTAGEQAGQERVVRAKYVRRRRRRPQRACASRSAAR